MVDYKFNNPEFSDQNLSKRFDLYGRWSVSEVDMSQPDSTVIHTVPQSFCSNSFVKIRFSDDGLTLLDAQPGDGLFIAKIFELEKEKPSFPFILAFDQNALKVSTHKLLCSNHLSQEVVYNWRTGAKHKYLISSCYPSIRCTVIDSYSLAVQLKEDYLDSFYSKQENGKDFLILWGKNSKDTPLLISFTSEIVNMELNVDILHLTSVNNRFMVHVGPLFGAALIETSHIEEIPSDWIERAKIISEGAFNIPVDSEDKFEVDYKENKVKIKRTFIRSRINTDSDKKEVISIYPPAIFYPHTGGQADSGKCFEIYTLYGKTYISKSDSISYSLSIPPEIDQELSIPALSEIEGEFETGLIEMLNERVEKEISEAQEFPKFIDYEESFTYAFTSLAQQMLACHKLLKDPVKQKLLKWTRVHLEYFFNEKWIDKDFYGFSYPEGHWSPYDIDCYCGNIFLCISHYLEASGDIEFVRNLFPKLKKMMNYFKIAIDPMTCNGFSSPSWHINWASDTLETVGGLFGISKIAKTLEDEDWQEIYGFAALYRCAAVGLLFARDIYMEIPGFPSRTSWLFDHWDCRETNLSWYAYPLACAIAVHTSYGFIPLAYKKSFWHCYLPFWPVSPELCLLHINLNWKDNFEEFYKQLCENWPDWLESNETTFAHGAPFLIFRAIYGQEDRREILKKYLVSENIQKKRPFLEFARWKHFFFVCLLLNKDQLIIKIDKKSNS